MSRASERVGLLFAAYCVITTAGVLAFALAEGAEPAAGYTAEHG